MWGLAIVMVHVVCLSVCHACISLKLSEIDVWLLGNSNMNVGFPIQNLPSYSWLKVRFHHFGCFQVGTSPIKTEMGVRFSEWCSGNRHLTVISLSSHIGRSHSKTRFEIGNGNRILPPEDIVSNSVLVAYHCHWSRCLQIWCVGRKWDPPTCRLLPSNTKMAGGRHRGPAIVPSDWGWHLVIQAYMIDFILVVGNGLNQSILG